MSRALIAFGTGVVGCVGTVRLACHLGSLRNVVPIVSLATGILGLAVTKACKKKDQSLDKKDFILVVGASMIGSAAGGTAVVVIATLINGIAVGALMGSLCSSLISNLFLMPFRVISLAMSRPAHFERFQISQRRSNFCLFQ